MHTLAQSGVTELYSVDTHQGANATSEFGPGFTQDHEAAQVKLGALLACAPYGLLLTHGMRTHAQRQVQHKAIPKHGDSTNRPAILKHFGHKLLEVGTSTRCTCEWCGRTFGSAQAVAGPCQRPSINLKHEHHI